MIRVEPQPPANITNARDPIQPAVTDSNCVCRIWRAVVNFFTWIAETITAWFRSAWSYCYTPSTPTPVQATGPSISPSVRFDMPHTAEAFIDQAVALHLQILGPATAEGGTFKKNFEEISNFDEVALAIVKAYVFSNAQEDFAFFDYQIRTEVPGHIEPIRVVRIPVIDARGNPVHDEDGEQLVDRVTIGGPRHTYPTISIAPTLRELRRRLDQLSEADQRALFGKCDFKDMDRMPISRQAKELLQEIHRHVYAVQQGRPQYAGAVQALYTRGLSSSECNG